jgi:hypothetical protein
MCSAVNFTDASALESLEAIAVRLHAAVVEFHPSEVKGPVMDALKRCGFIDYFDGQVFLIAVWRGNGTLAGSGPAMIVFAIWFAAVIDCPTFVGIDASQRNKQSIIHN